MPAKPKISEQFNDVGPFLDSDGRECFGIEKDTKTYLKFVGQLWVGSTWLTVADARDLRDWLDKVLP